MRLGQRYLRHSIHSMEQEEDLVFITAKYPHSQDSGFHAALESQFKMWCTETHSQSSYHSHHQLQYSNNTCTEKAW